jgi:hypothetical protein
MNNEQHRQGLDAFDQSALSRSVLQTFLGGKRGQATFTRDRRPPDQKTACPLYFPQLLSKRSASMHEATCRASSPQSSDPDGHIIDYASHFTISRRRLPLLNSVIFSPYFSATLLSNFSKDTVTSTRRAGRCFAPLRDSFVRLPLRQ